MNRKINSGKIGNVVFSLFFVLVIIIYYDIKFNDSSIKSLISSHFYKSNTAPISNDSIISSSENSVISQGIPGESVVSSDELTCVSNNSESIDYIKTKYHQRAAEVLDYRCENYTEIYKLLQSIKKENDADLKRLEEFVIDQDIIQSREVITKIKSRSQDYDISQFESKVLELEKIADIGKSAKVIYPVTIICNSQQLADAECPWNFHKNGNPMQELPQISSAQSIYGCSTSDFKFDRLNSKIILTNHCTAKFTTDQSDESKIFYKKLSCGGFLNKKCHWDFNKNGRPLFIKSINNKVCSENSYEFQTSNNLIVILDKCQAEFESDINL